jgi:hypothetical protein
MGLACFENADIMQMQATAGARASMERDYYSTLGISRLASQQALKRAYRSRIRQVHPDLNPADEVATDRARRVIEAYSVLSDPASRCGYDRTLARPALRAAVPIYACDGPCPLWVTRFFAILLFFAVAAGMFYVVATSVADNTPVFRPSLGIVETASSQAGFAEVSEKPVHAVYRIGAQRNGGP